MPGSVIQGKFLPGVPLFHAPLGVAVPQAFATSAVQRSPMGNARQLPSNFGAGLPAGGERLPSVVLRKMEAAFQADFSDVRIHAGGAASSLRALAFTQGSGIWFAPGKYDPHNWQGQQLLGHELAHVLQQRAGRARNPFGAGVAVVQDPMLEAEAERLGQRAAFYQMAVQQKPAFVVQRAVGVQPGQVDPLTEFATAGTKSLLYGMSTTRKKTSLRLDVQDAHLNYVERRTIDAYNRDIGLNAVMDKASDPTVIFLLREALLENDVVGSWRTHFPGAVTNVATDPDLTAWIQALAANRYRISLYDLGLPEGSRADYKAAAKRRKKKLTSGHRFEKNFTHRTQYKSTEVTALPSSKSDVNILEWLAADQTYAGAQNDAATMDPTDRADLAKWVRTAFWRRTSKLGIDFTTSRGHTIHFNTAGDRKWSYDKAAKTGVMPTLRAGDLAKINDTYGRAITSSEYRHTKKGIKSGSIPGNRVNFYDEF